MASVADAPRQVFRVPPVGTLRQGRSMSQITLGLSFVGLLGAVVVQTGCNCNGDSGESGSGSGTSDGTDGMSTGAGTSMTTSTTSAGSASGGTGGSSGGGSAGTDTGADEDAGQISLSIPLYDWQDISLTAGQTFQLAVVEDVPEEFGEFLDVTFDLEQTVNNLAVQRTDGGTEPIEIEAVLRLAPGDQMGTVCETGTMEGPVTVQADANATALTVEPAEISATMDGLAAVNSGTVSVCYQITANADLLVSLSEILASISTSVSCDAPADLSGAWSGTYSCVASGGPECGDEGGPIMLTVYQGNHTAGYIDDGGAFYFGSVCGNEFRHSGGGFGYSESGVMTLEDDNNASKMSHYTVDLSTCEGDCTDDLTRQ
jgi:hypothetical protein